MAKRLPADLIGMPRISAPTESGLDRLLKFVELGQGVIGEFTQAKKETINELSGNMEDMFALIENAESSNELQAITSMNKSLKRNVEALDNPLLTLSSSLVDARVQDKTVERDKFRNTASDIVKSFSPDGIFSEDNMTIEKIMNWNMEDMRNHMQTVKDFSADFYDSDGEVRFKNYIFTDDSTGQKYNANNLKMKIDSFNRNVGMALQALENDGIIAKGEAYYIANSTEDNYNDHVKNVTEIEDKYIDELTKNITFGNKFKVNLEEDMSKSIADLQKDIGIDFVALTSMMTDDPQVKEGILGFMAGMENAQNLTMAQLKQALPNAYARLIEDSKETIDANHINMRAAIKRRNLFAKTIHPKTYEYQDLKDELGLLESGKYTKDSKGNLVLKAIEKNPFKFQGDSREKTLDSLSDDEILVDNVQDLANAINPQSPSKESVKAFQDFLNIVPSKKEEDGYGTFGPKTRKLYQKHRSKSDAQKRQLARDSMVNKP